MSVAGANNGGASTRNGELLAAFILKEFRAAARDAVSARHEQEATATFAYDTNDMTSAVLRVFDGSARAWSMDDGEMLALLGLRAPTELQSLNATALHEAPTRIIAPR